MRRMLIKPKGWMKEGRKAERKEGRWGDTRINIWMYGREQIDERRKGHK